MLGVLWVRAYLQESRVIFGFHHSYVQPRFRAEFTRVEVNFDPGSAEAGLVANELWDLDPAPYYARRGSLGASRLERLIARVKRVVGERA